MAVDRDGADVQEPADVRVAAGVQQRPRGVDDFGLERPPRGPVADAGGAVVDDVGARRRPSEGRRIGQVAGDQFDAEAPKEGHVAARPHERADSFATTDQPLGDVTAQQARRPGHQVHSDRHRPSSELGCRGSVQCRGVSRKSRPANVRSALTDSSPCRRITRRGVRRRPLIRHYPMREVSCPMTAVLRKHVRWLICLVGVAPFGCTSEPAATTPVPAPGVTYRRHAPADQRHPARHGNRRRPAGGLDAPAREELPACRGRRRGSPQGRDEETRRQAVQRHARPGRGRAEEQPPRYVLKEVASGVGTSIDGRDVVISKETYKKQGADMGFFGDWAVESAYGRVKAAAIVLRSDTLAVYDSPHDHAPRRQARPGRVALRLHARPTRPVASRPCSGSWTRRTTARISTPTGRWNF